MGEGITPDQFKILAELRKEAKETVKVEYVDILKSNRLTVLKVDYSPSHLRYYIVFKLNTVEYTIEIEKSEQVIALHQGSSEKAITFVCDIIAEKLAKIFLGEMI